MKKLGFGMMRLPLLKADDPTSVNETEVNKMVDLFLEKGFIYFDTAYMYHNHQSENYVRKCLVERYPRDKFILASKLPTMFLKTEEDQERIFNEQLSKCGVSYFDYYLLHNLSVANYEKAEKFNSFAFATKKKEAGFIKHLGFSFHGKACELEKILAKHSSEVEFVQLQINYIDWESDNVESRKCYEVARKYQKKIIVMEPVKGGTLAKLPQEAEDKLRSFNPQLSIPSWAIRFAASLEGVIMVLSGMSNLAQMEDNLSYMTDFTPLSQGEEKLIFEIVNIINENIKIRCTTCGYCVEKCPKKINIPYYFSLYNETTRNLNKNHAQAIELYEKEIALGHGKASDCISCLQCEKMCPQHLPITSHLVDVKNILEKAK